MSAAQKVPPLAEREQPGLSKTLTFPRALDRCQSCGAEGDANARPEMPPSPLFVSGSLQKWQEADPNDRFTADDGQPVIVILCADCSKRLIDPHPRLYRMLDAWHPIPGVMGLCHGCRFQKELTCSHPWLKANGGKGLHVRFPKPAYAHLNYGGGRGEMKHIFHGPPSTCAGRALHVVEQTESAE